MEKDKNNADNHIRLDDSLDPENNVLSSQSLDEKDNSESALHTDSVVPILESEKITEEEFYYNEDEEMLEGLPNGGFQLFFLCALMALLGGICFGYPLGINAGVLSKLHDQYGLSDFGQELIASSIVFGAMIGTFLGSFVSDLIGRRMSLVISALFGAACIVALSCSFNMVFLGIVRIFHGISVGLVVMVSPMYVSETSSNKYRGTCVALFQFSVTFGIFIAYCVSLAFESLETNISWRLQFGGNVVFNILLSGYAFLAPETPRYLIVKGRMKKAKAFICHYYRISSKKEMKKFMKKFKGDEKDEEEGNGEKKMSSIKAAAFSWKQLVLGLIMACGQQLTGINAIIFYAPKIVEKAGFGSTSASLMATMGVGFWNMASTTFAIFFVDFFGRKPLMMVALFGMFVCNIVIGLAFIIPGLGWGLAVLSILCLLGFVGCFELGPGPLFFTIVSEIFPQESRAIGISFCAFSQWTGNLLVVLLFVSVTNWIGKGPTFLIFAFFTLVSLILLCCLQPETKGKSLEENVMRFQKHWYDAKAPIIDEYRSLEEEEEEEEERNDDGVDNINDGEDVDLENDEEPKDEDIPDYSSNDVVVEVDNNSKDGDNDKGSNKPVDKLTDEDHPDHESLISDVF